MAWDAGLAAATAEYEERTYNFCGDNCHCYVARFLNDVSYNGRRCAMNIDLLINDLH